MIGAKADAIERGEDRERFKELMLEIGLDVPVSGIAHNLEEAWSITEKIGRYPPHYPTSLHIGWHWRRHRLQPRRV